MGSSGITHPKPPFLPLHHQMGAQQHPPHIPNPVPVPAGKNLSPGKASTILGVTPQGDTQNEEPLELPSALRSPGCPGRDEGAESASHEQIPSPAGMEEQIPSPAGSPSLAARRGWLWLRHRLGFSPWGPSQSSAPAWSHPALRLPFPKLQELLCSSPCPISCHGVAEWMKSWHPTGAAQVV